MGHTSRVDNDIVVFELEGKSLGTMEDNYELLDTLYEYIKQEKFKAVMDFSAIERLNSRGIGICVSMVTALRNRDGDLKLACLNERIESLLRKMRMFKIFQYYGTVEEAIKSYG